jgi:glucose-6-phosphate 1-epimerase
MTALGPPLRVTSRTSTGAIYDHGAHITSWIPAGDRDVLWMSQLCDYDSAVALRGGIPVVFPWFGAGRSRDLRPSHGFGRLSPWTLADVDEQSDRVTVTHVLSDVESPAFPSPFRATLVVGFGADMDVRLTVENTGEMPFSYEEALHTYLAVGDVRQVSILGLEGEEYLDSVRGGERRTQTGPVVVDGEVDRIYLSDAEVQVVDPVLGRTIGVRKVNSANTVVWNPWIERAAALADMPDDGWQTMLCIEGANILDNAVTLEPGRSHTMGYALSVDPH